ncbi:MAG: hypothetical protein PHE68_00185 [Candidatus Peribacteraceae bacterium]|nr:hypothetical protein [Candidatus Peribacteraceae bacterium]MDD5074773.1 hypothetical protein [Candidatus Peribacteraceae bacterium]
MVNILPIRTGDEVAYVNQREVPRGVALRRHADGTFAVDETSSNQEATRRFITSCSAQVADAVHAVA